MQSILLIALQALITLSTAENIAVTVGNGAQLVFSPDTVKADVGDTLSFSYFPKNHSVVQSSFADPCHSLNGGFFSGFQPLSAGRIRGYSQRY